MKKIYSILLIFFCVLIASCSQEEELVSDNNTGYLRLAVSTVASETKSGDFDPDTYKPKQFYVAIHDADGKIVKSTEDFQIQRFCVCVLEPPFSLWSYNKTFSAPNSDVSACLALLNLH